MPEEDSPPSSGKCPYCQGEVPAGALKCQPCGEQTAQRRCQSCGTAIPKRAETCPHCNKTQTRSPGLLLKMLVLHVFHLLAFAMPLIFGRFVFRSYYLRRSKIVAGYCVGLATLALILNLNRHEVTYDSTEWPEETPEVINEFASTPESKAAMESDIGRNFFAACASGVHKEAVLSLATTQTGRERLDPLLPVACSCMALVLTKSGLAEDMQHQIITAFSQLSELPRFVSDVVMNGGNPQLDPLDAVVVELYTTCEFYPGMADWSD